MHGNEYRSDIKYNDKKVDGHQIHMAYAICMSITLTQIIQNKLTLNDGRSPFARDWSAVVSLQL
jgi:hypothetical protein